MVLDFRGFGISSVIALRGSKLQRARSSELAAAFGILASWGSGSCRHVSDSQYHGWQDHLKGGPGILYRDSVTVYTTVQEPCPFGLPIILIAAHVWLFWGLVAYPI